MMPDTKTFTLVRLRNFKGGLHLSRGRTNTYTESAKTLHSDTLKSAIFVCALQLYGNEAIAKDSFLDRFRISSAFPFGVDLEGVPQYFFPKPQGVLAIKIPGEERAEKKKLKRLQYLEKELFEKIIQGEGVELSSGNLYKQWGSLGKLQDIDSKRNIELFTSEAFQHVAIARDQSTDSAPYYVDKKYFSEKAGLFFLLCCSEEKVRKKIFAAMRLLADNGIGTDRNNGMGMFSFDEGKDILEDFNIQVPSSSGFQLNLSLYLPRNIAEPGSLNEAKYEILKRGGYIASPDDKRHLTIRKRSVYMFSEGAIFKTSMEPEGRVADLRPNQKALEEAEIPPVTHPIYRDGRAIFLPCSVKNME